MKKILRRITEFAALAAVLITAFIAWKFVLIGLLSVAVLIFGDIFLDWLYDDNKYNITLLSYKEKIEVLDFLKTHMENNGHKIKEAELFNAIYNGWPVFSLSFKNDKGDTFSTQPFHYFNIEGSNRTLEDIKTQIVVMRLEMQINL